MASSSGAFEVAHLVDVNIATNTNFFGNDIIESSSVASVGPRKYSILAMLEQTAILTMTYTRDAKTVFMKFNAGLPLNAGAVYVFDIFLEDGVRINLQHNGPLMKTTCSIITSGDISF